MNRRNFIKRLILAGLAIFSSRHPLDYISQSYKPKKKWKTRNETYEEAKRRVLQQHTLDMERALWRNLFGNGK